MFAAAINQIAAEARTIGGVKKKVEHTYKNTVQGHRQQQIRTHTHTHNLAGQICSNTPGRLSFPRGPHASVSECLRAPVHSQLKCSGRVVDLPLSLTSTILRLTLTLHRIRNGFL